MSGVTSRFIYDVWGMAKHPDDDCYTLAQTCGMKPECWDVLVYKVDANGDREQPDPVWEFEGLAKGDLAVIVGLIEEKLQAELGEEL